MSTLRWYRVQPLTVGFAYRMTIMARSPEDAAQNWAERYWDTVASQPRARLEVLPVRSGADPTQDGAPVLLVIELVREWRTTRGGGAT